MYCVYQDREELEDDLYQDDEGDSEASEANSELEFHLYSQLHYSSNPGEMEEQTDREDEAESQDSQQIEVTKKTADEQKDPRESVPIIPDVSLLQQNPKTKKKKAENANKGKKRKSNPQGHKPSFPFEEVIVIDSSPDVISISDGVTSSDNEGVCALKGHHSKLQKTSTPAQQGGQKKKRVLHVPVSVESSSSQSDLEEPESEPECDLSDSSDSSNSIGLENWMILGRGTQDGDQSISLNLEGGFDSSTDVDDKGSTWLVSDKDKAAQIFNKGKNDRTLLQRVSNRYYTSKSVQCRNCNKFGHLSKNCPEPKKLSPCILCGNLGHLAGQCASKHCNNCGLPGHLYESCIERAPWHKQCHRCNMTGHFFDTCPEIWRQYHLTTKAGTPVMHQGSDKEPTSGYCYNCSRKGHFGHMCTNQRMFRGTYPTTPFINHYDTLGDIKRRQHRIRIKVNELKKKNLFPSSCQTPLTPGPPKKKQKIRHHDNNHHPNHSLYRTPYNHKPSKTHIFFNDNYEMRGLAPKVNKYKQQESPGSVKPWKPKRPVPTSRDTPSKLILDEADDFPRGRGKAEHTEMKKKKRKTKKPKQVPSVPPEGHRDRRPHTPSCTVKGKRKDKKWRTANNKHDAQMYPSDENLFIIKQRRRRR